MKYLLLEYAEPPISVTDLPDIEYDYKQNLNVLEKTNSPAIEIANNVDTRTVTRINEVSEDGKACDMYLATQTFTKVQNESPDSDDGYPTNVATKTHTFVDNESPDSDSDIYYSALPLITKTLTRVELESTDDDL